MDDMNILLQWLRELRDDVNLKFTPHGNNFHITQHVNRHYKGFGQMCINVLGKGDEIPSDTVMNYMEKAGFPISIITKGNTIDKYLKVNNAYYLWL